MGANQNKAEKVQTEPTVKATIKQGTWVYVTNSVCNEVSVIDALTRRIIRTIPVGSKPIALAVHSTRERVYVANADSDNISVIHAVTDQVIDTVRGHPCSLAIDLDRERIYVGISTNKSSFVSVIDAVNHQEIHAIPVKGRLSALAIDPTKARLYVGEKGLYVDDFNDGKIWVIDTLTYQEVHIVSGTHRTSFTLVVDPVRERIYRLGYRSISVIDSVTYEVISDRRYNSVFPRGLVIEPVSERIYVTNSYLNEVLVINPITLEMIDRIPVGDGPWGVNIDPITGMVYVGNGSVSVISAATNKVIDGIDTKVGFFEKLWNGMSHQSLAIITLKKEVKTLKQLCLYVLRDPLIPSQIRKEFMMPERFYSLIYDN